MYEIKSSHNTATITALLYFYLTYKFLYHYIADMHRELEKK